MIIDATDLMVGRLSSFAAKKALLGEKVDIVNCEKAVVSGKKQEIVAKYFRKYQMGVPKKGPFLHRRADRLLRRTIRGMLPYKQPKGVEAYKRVMCYNAVPNELEGKKADTLKSANYSKLPNLKYLKLGDVSKLIGGKDQDS
ncbi:50S ribosomal protein L13 [Nanoarchaeota archaeon]